MEGKPTYTCQKCGYVIRVSSEIEIELHRKKHKEICDGELSIPSGNCLALAMMNCILHPKLLFCYSFVPAKIEGQKFLHAWNETKGFFDEKNNKKEFKISNLPDSEDFVLDQSNQENKFIANKLIYYQFNKIDESEVKKLSIIDLLHLIKESIKNSGNAWSWI